jgi:hypothetical protein
MLRQLTWWCNNTARLNGLQPCQACYFQPDSFSNARVIMSDRIEQRSSPRRHGSCWPKLLRGILRPAVLCDVGALGTPQPMGMLPAQAGCDWEIIILADDMRPGATPHIGLYRNGNCNAKCMSFNLYQHSSGWPPRKPMMQSYYSIDLLEDVCTLYRYRSRLPNHTSVRYTSWSYDLIYDIIQVWADSYQ